MAATKEKCTTVSDLQRFLRDRGVVVDNKRKAELCELVQLAEKVKLLIDPDALIEDRASIISNKLQDQAGHDNPNRSTVKLQNPGFLCGTPNIGILPDFSEFDVCSYQMSQQNASVSMVRDYRKSEGFQMMQDGHVLEMEACVVPTIPPVDGYFAVKSKVKPRTRDKDPLTNAKYYSLWILLTTVDMDLRGCILSAFCSCKGGYVTVIECSSGIHVHVCNNECLISKVKDFYK
jgi:hypothetical protein